MRAFSSQDSVSFLLTQIDEFLFYRQQSVVSWHSLLGHLSSVCLLIPVGRLRMRSLQLVLRSSWDFEDKLVEVEWFPSNQEDLLWWSDLSSLLQGVSLEDDHPVLHLWSDASDQGWGADLCDQFILGLWSPEECSLSISLQELCTIYLGLLHFRHLLRGQVWVFADNTTALSYIRNRWEDVLPGAQCQSPAPPHWAE